MLFLAFGNVYISIYVFALKYLKMIKNNQGFFFLCSI